MKEKEGKNYTIISLSFSFHNLNSFHNQLMSQLPAFCECIQTDKFTEGNANDIMQSFTYKDNAVHFEQIFP